MCVCVSYVKFCYAYGCEPRFVSLCHIVHRASLSAQKAINMIVDLRFTYEGGNLRKAEDNCIFMGR